MYLSRFSVKNIRSITEATMDFAKGEEAGWHVLLGSNGSGKSSMVRAFALLMMGEKEAWAARQDFAQWMRKDQKVSLIEGIISADPEFDLIFGDTSASNETQLQVSIERAAPDNSAPDLKFSANPEQRGIWGGGSGWFSASFGPFRRFTGGDVAYDRLFVTNKRLAPHLTALGEDVALTDAMKWLTELNLKAERQREADAMSLDPGIDGKVISFLNHSKLLPHGSIFLMDVSRGVFIRDANQFNISLDQLSDGYRSALSLVIELIRQIFTLFKEEKIPYCINPEAGEILAPGVVVIDEIDVHLHPSWQRDIGKALTRCFPNIQFIVTTHSPIVCRAIARDDGSLRGSVWRLPSPGTDEQFRRVDQDELNQLVYGDVLDAYSTELFGHDVLRSHAGSAKLERLAQLNTQALNAALSAEEQAERKALRRLFPASSGALDQQA